MTQIAKRLGIVAVACLLAGGVFAQMSDRSAGANSVNRSFWDGWYGQVGFDMALQNPYGYNFADVFPNGKTFGVDIAIGRWFTPVLGLRGKLNWENGIGLFENHHANWLAPFDEPGRNLDKGGYVGLYGDMLFNLHSLFCGYDETRFWNLSVFPRAGFDYNFGVEKGSPLLGAGISNTFRLNDRLSLYFDVSYNMVSSGHVGVVKNTGTNSNSNGYLNFDAGVQIDFDKTVRRPQPDLPLSSGWFLQGGLDMHLQNPYGCNFFSGVFPNGKTFGIEGAVGRHFTPELAVRGKLDWENGLFKNGHLKWVAPADEPEKNHDKGGYILATIDPLFNLLALFGGADDSRKWNISAYPRAGLIHNMAISSTSPLIGLGVENTYRLNERWSLYLDVDYQVTTSEQSYGQTGMTVSRGSNGFFGVHTGVQVDL